MTPTEIKLIRETWSKVTPIADTAARMFYERLFEIDPDARDLFADADMKAQGQKLLEAMQLVVENAGNLADIMPVLTELGRRHVSWGVRNHHYDSVGAALFWTFERALGRDFTEEVRAAWTKAYVQISTTMRGASHTSPERSGAKAGFARTAAAVCLALGLAAGMTAMTAPMTATQVEAFGLDDIGKGLKKVGGAVKDGAKKAGGVAKETVKAAREIKKTAREAVRDGTLSVTGKAYSKIAREMNEQYHRARGTYDEAKKKELDETERQVAEDIGGLGKWAGKQKNKIKTPVKKTGPKKAWEKVMTGKITRLPPNKPGQWGGSGAGKTPGKALTHQAGKKITLQPGSRTEWTGPKGARAPVTGIRKENLKPAQGRKGTMALRQGRPEQQRPSKRPPTATPENVPGPQSTKKPRPRRKPYYPRPYPRPRAEQKPSAATPGKANTQAGRDKSVAGRPVGGKKPIGRDKSIWGRPVGGKGSTGQDRMARQRPAGITKQNLRPSGKSRPVSRDRSLRGRRVGKSAATVKRGGRRTERRRHQSRILHRKLRSSSRADLRRGGRRINRGDRNFRRSR